MKSSSLIPMPGKNLTPIAAGFILAGLALMAMPTVTAAGLIYTGVAAIVLSNLSFSPPLTIVAFIAGAVLVDNLVADIGTNLVDMSALGLPDTDLPSISIDTNG